MKFKEYKGLDLPQLAADVLAQWDAEDTFHKSISTREGHPAFVFYEGPPSANGLPGIHHVMARTIKDIICRYKTQQGYLVHRRISGRRFRSRSTTAPAARRSWSSRECGRT